MASQNKKYKRGDYETFRSQGQRPERQKTIELRSRNKKCTEVGRKVTTSKLPWESHRTYKKIAEWYQTAKHPKGACQKKNQAIDLKQTKTERRKRTLPNACS